MKPNRLRVYYGPEANVAASSQPGPARDTVTISLGDIFPLLADAVSSERTWLADFAEDEITVSSDLYEVLLAYQHFRRPSSAS
jgi:hypothetical protein